MYLSAFWPDRGQSMMDLFGEGPLPPYIGVRADGAIEFTDDELAREGLCAELDPARLDEWAAHNVLSSMTSLGAPSTAPDQTHPTTYIVLERDRLLPPPAQEAMAARADHVERMATSHQAMIADPDGLAAILTRIST